MEERIVFAIGMLSNSRGDPHLVDIYALWWNSSLSQAYTPLALNGISKDISSSFHAVSSRLGNWTCRVPPHVPSNYFITIRMITSGQKPLGNNGTNFIEDDSPEFITFNNNSTVTSLPNNGIRMAVPTPMKTTNTTRIVTTTIFSFVTTTETRPLHLYQS